MSLDTLKDQLQFWSSWLSTDSLFEELDEEIIEKFIIVYKTSKTLRQFRERINKNEPFTIYDEYELRCTLAMYEMGESGGFARDTLKLMKLGNKHFRFNLLDFKLQEWIVDHCVEVGNMPNNYWTKHMVLYALKKYPTWCEGNCGIYVLAKNFEINEVLEKHSVDQIMQITENEIARDRESVRKFEQNNENRREWLKALSEMQSGKACN